MFAHGKVTCQSACTYPRWLQRHTRDCIRDGARHDRPTRVASPASRAGGRRCRRAHASAASTSKSAAPARRTAPCLWPARPARPRSRRASLPRIHQRRRARDRPNTDYCGSRSAAAAARRCRRQMSTLDRRRRSQDLRLGRTRAQGRARRARWGHALRQLRASTSRRCASCSTRGRIQRTDAQRLRARRSTRRFRRRRAQCCCGRPRAQGPAAAPRRRPDRVLACATRGRPSSWRRGGPASRNRQCSRRTTAATARRVSSAARCSGSRCRDAAPMAGPG